MSNVADRSLPSLAGALNVTVCPSPVAVPLAVLVVITALSSPPLRITVQGNPKVPVTVTVPVLSLYGKFISVGSTVNDEAFWVTAVSFSIFPAVTKISPLRASLFLFTLFVLYSIACRLPVVVPVVPLVNSSQSGQTIL